MVDRALKASINSLAVKSKIVETVGDTQYQIAVQCCFTSSVDRQDYSRDGEPRTATSTLTAQLLMMMK